MDIKKTAIVLLAMAAAISYVGCGAGGKPSFLKDLVPATGRVTVKGQPLAGANVIFVPEPGSTGAREAMGVTDDKGVYELNTLVSGMAPKDCKGVMPGKYVVAISRIAMPDGGPMPTGLVDEGHALAKGAKQFVPAPNNDPNTSTLKATVAPPKAENNFDL